MPFLMMMKTVPVNTNTIITDMFSTTYTGARLL